MAQLYQFDSDWSNWIIARMLILFALAEDGEMDDRVVRTSKFMSYVLRHRPQAIGLHLDEQGWAMVDELIETAVSHGKTIDRAIIEEVVAKNDKKRFAFSADGTKIRASQGHSIPIDLGLTAVNPPRILFHGTAAKFMESIRQQGLEPRRRHHVHLSADYETAVKVGSRHGTPVVLQIDAARMVADGFDFYLSENGVWLTDIVVPEYFTVADMP